MLIIIKVEEVGVFSTSTHWIGLSSLSVTPGGGLAGELAGVGFTHFFSRLT